MDEVGLELEGGENAMYLGDAGRSCFALSQEYPSIHFIYVRYKE